MSRSKLPKYRRQKDRRADRAFVQLGDRRVYLGDYGSPESRELYERTVQEWLANGKQPPVNPAGLRVVELAARFWTFAKGFYRHPDGTSTSSLDNYRIALRPLKRLYGSLLVSEFGPLCLKAIRADWVQQGLSRKSVNEFASLIKHVFKWGVSEELVSASIYHALQAVEGLRRGRSDARETEPVRPVPEQDIEAIRPHVSRQVWALVQLQLLTGARPGELLRLRPVDLDTSGKVWTYRPADHKAAWRGHGRTVYFGPRAQEILQPFLARKVDACCFSPAEAETERRTALHARRTTPLSCGNRPGTNRAEDPETTPGGRYTDDSYRVAIQRACLKVYPPPARLLRQESETQEAYRKRLGGPDGEELRAWRRQHTWHPHRLRHNAATRLRQQYGLDLAQTILGHRIGSQITELYSEKNVAGAVAAILQVG